MRKIINIKKFFAYPSPLTSSLRRAHTYSEFFNINNFSNTYGDKKYSDPQVKF